MTAGARFPAIPRHELFTRLAERGSANIVVVTPNRRLAQELAREFDEGQAAGGLAMWETADILPFGAFVERLYEDALYSGFAARLPLLLTDAQEQELWRAAIRASEWGGALLAVSQTAADCCRAWELAQQWRIAGALGGFLGNEDARAFAEWAKAYVHRCERDGNTDAARLPDVVTPLLREPALRKPGVLVSFGFDVVTPQAREFFENCARQGVELRSCEPDAKAGDVRRVIFASAREELDAAAQWARAQLQADLATPLPTQARAPKQLRIGVVIPDLGERRKEVARVFSRVMHPGYNLPGAKLTAMPFNISLGAPLADYPLVRTALSILELACGEIAFEQASKLIRSPFLAGAEAEMAARARLDAAVRRIAPARITLGKLVALVAPAPELRRRFDALFALTRDAPAGERSPHEWGRHFSALLAAVGFPGERGVDSGEFQTQAKFNDILTEVAKLERVAPRMGFRQALACLRRLCSDTLFQPETPDAPVQIMGVLESAGLGFDALWVSGLTDDAWPLRARPNPFIPPALQRKAGIPEASPEATLARGRRITEGWLKAADRVIVSCPAMDGDRALIASPLISAMPAALAETVNAAPFPRFRERIFFARGIETVEDGKAPPLATRTPRGGTRILSDQSACPFRAFARHRLGAQALEEPVEGPDARSRGRLLHTLMKELWDELQGSESLHGDCGFAIEKAAAAAVAEAELEEPFAGLERARLARLAREWLEIERARAPFAVIATEEKRKFVVAGLEINGRIDRMDRLESGGHALIDYKTGRSTPNEWMGERPDDPQLPVYALSAKESISAVAFAKLRTGEMRYMGFSQHKDLIPGVRQAQDWGALLDSWKTEIESLGKGFAEGDARVAPKNLLQTCTYCDLQPLCRVHERIDALASGGEGGDD